MAATYVQERQIEYWTSRQVEEFFRKLGYSCSIYPVGAAVEKHIPADFVFKPAPKVKMFGFQYKVLYHNGNDHWKLNARQHATISSFSWIYYALSELRSAQNSRAALHALRIKQNNFPYSPSLLISTSFPYSRWWSFYLSLITCKVGINVESISGLRKALSSEDDEASLRVLQDTVDIFLMDQVERKLLKFSPDRSGYQ